MERPSPHVLANALQDLQCLRLTLYADMRASWAMLLLGFVLGVANVSLSVLNARDAMTKGGIHSTLLALLCGYIGVRGLTQFVDVVSGWLRLAWIIRNLRKVIDELRQTMEETKP